MKRFIAGLILTFTLVSISQAVWAGNSQNAVTIQDQYYCRLSERLRKVPPEV